MKWGGVEVDGVGWGGWSGVGWMEWDGVVGVGWGGYVPQCSLVTRHDSALTIVEPPSNCVQVEAVEVVEVVAAMADRPRCLQPS